MPITTKQVEMAILAMDTLLTIADSLADKIQRWREEGLISIDQQVAIVDKVNEIRSKVGTPPPSASGVNEPT